MITRALLLSLVAILSYVAGKQTDCPSDTVLSSDLTACLDIAYDGYGATCQDNVQCSARLLAGGVCIGKTCQCTDGYHYLHGQCFPSRGLGAACTASVECFAHTDADTMVCDANGKCVCGDGAYQRDSSTCRRIGELGEPCDLDDDCQRSDPEPVCNNSAYTCELPGGARSTLRRRSATERRRNADCSEPNASLTDGGKCVCNRGFFRPAPTSDCIPELGETCAADDDCLHISEGLCRPSASGNDSICACSGGYVPSISNRRCIKTRKFAFSCLEDSMCSYYGGVCKQKLCACPEGKKYLDDEINCWPDVELEKPCDVAKDCTVASGVGVDCVDGHCQCVAGYHATTTGDCWPDAEGFGSPCKELRDCPFGVGALCGDEATPGQCTCKSTYFQGNLSVSGDRPYCLAGIGAPCEYDSCAVNSAECHQECVEVLPGYPCQNVSECRCPEGFAGSADFSECLPERQAVGDNCSDTAQCTPQLGPHSHCLEGQCVCTDGFHFQVGYCWKTRLLGQSCDRATECYLEENIHLAQCRNSLCECPYDWIRQPDSKRCEQVSGKAAQPAATLIVLGSLVFWSLLARFL